MHVSGSSSALWTDAAAELAVLGRAIVYDRRCFARSERPEPLVMDAHLHADDAAHLIDALGAAPAIVIGRSFGGEVAVDLALRYPDRVRALALLEGGGFVLSEAFVQWDAALAERVFVAAEADADTVGATMLRSVVGDGAWEEIPEPVKTIFRENGPAIVAEHRGGLLDVSAEELGSIRQPTLLVAGEGSPPVFRDVTSRQAQAMPGAKVEWVEGGHLIHPAHPVVLAFVDEVLR